MGSVEQNSGWSWDIKSLYDRPMLTAIHLGYDVNPNASLGCGGRMANDKCNFEREGDVIAS